MKKILLSLFICCFCQISSSLAAKTDMWITDTTVAKLEQTFQKYGYDNYLFIKGGIVPRIFLKKFPKDYTQIKDNNQRNRLFIRILTPLALLVNEEITKERNEVLALNKEFKKNQELTPAQEKRLEELALKYDAFTRLKGYRRHQLQIQMLRAKVAPLPVSFLIAVSAIETNWGDSRIVKEGNSLYKELSWYTNEGLKPQGETEDDSYRIRVFPDILSSMRSYALRFNSDVNFEHARYLRMLKIASGGDFSGQEMAHSMLYQTPLQNYIGLLKYTITFYRLMYLDVTKLDNSYPKMTK